MRVIESAQALLFRGICCTIMSCFESEVRLSKSSAIHERRVCWRVSFACEVIWLGILHGGISGGIRRGLTLSGRWRDGAIARG
jgi:hypothetical protein